MTAPGLDDVRRAAARLQGVAHHTPVFTSRTLDALVGARVVLKAESLRRAGAFKFRGAYNAIAALPPDVRARGVAAFSSGNHAQAVALAASLLGSRATILMPGIRVVGVEPEAGDDVRRSLATGEHVAIPVPTTLADGLQTTSAGRLTLPVIRRLVADVVTVSDAQLLAAVRFLFERLKLVVEPSGAAGVAALLAGAVAGAGGTIGVVLSGGNVGVDRLRELLAAGQP